MIKSAHAAEGNTIRFIFHNELDPNQKPAYVNEEKCTGTGGTWNGKRCTCPDVGGKIGYMTKDGCTTCDSGKGECLDTTAVCYRDSDCPSCEHLCSNGKCVENPVKPKGYCEKDANGKWKAWNPTGQYTGSHSTCKPGYTTKECSGGTPYCTEDGEARCVAGKQCKNGGQYLPQRNKCQCAAGWSGDLCDEEENPCANGKPSSNSPWDPEKNKYVLDNTDFQCVCDANWTGDLCDIYNEVEATPLRSITSQPAEITTCADLCGYGIEECWNVNGSWGGYCNSQRYVTTGRMTASPYRTRATAIATEGSQPDERTTTDTGMYTGRMRQTASVTTLPISGSPVTPEPAQIRTEWTGRMTSTPAETTTGRGHCPDYYYGSRCQHYCPNARRPWDPCLNGNTPTECSCVTDNIETEGGATTASPTTTVPFQTQRSSCTENQDCESGKWCQVTSDSCTQPSGGTCQSKISIDSLKKITLPNGTILHAYKSNMSWWAAKEFCQAHGMALANKTLFSGMTANDLYQVFNYESGAYWLNDSGTSCFANMLSVIRWGVGGTSTASRDSLPGYGALCR